MAAPLTIRGQKTIPTTWQERILKRDFEIVLGKMLQPEQGNETETEEPYLRSANVQWEGVDLSDIKTMWFSPREKKELLLRVGDLVVNEGGDVGRCATWTGGLDACYFQNAVNRVRPRQKASTRFLYYWLYNIKHAGFIDAIVSRTTIAHLTAEKLEAVPMPDASPSDQERIATYLDASCAAIDAAVAAKQRQLDTLDELRHSNIYRAVTKGLDDSAALKESGIDWLGKMPSHWAIRRIKDIAELRSGDAIESEDITPAGDYPVYGGNGLRGYTSSFTHDGHFVLIGRQGALCGNINYANGKFWATEHAIVVTLLRKYDALWLGELLRVMNLNQYSNAAAQPGLAVDRIKFLRLPLPPPEEQIGIAEYVKGIILKSGRMTAHLESQIATLTAYRKSLIHECVTGQRRISESDVARVEHHRGFDNGSNPR